MNKVTYKAKCDALFEKAKAKGVILHFNPERLTFNRTNCLWLGGNIAVIEVDKNLCIDISAIGDVIAILYDENKDELASSKDKSNQGAFESNMSFYIKDDEELSQLLEDGRLVLRNNNWIEYGGIIYDEKTNKKYFIDLGMIVDNILDDDALVAIDQVLDDLDEIKEEILKQKED